MMRWAKKVCGIYSNPLDLQIRNNFIIENLKKEIKGVNIKRDGGSNSQDQDPSQKSQKPKPKNDLDSQV